MNTFRMQANLLKAMAHPVRLRILDILSHGEACVCHLTTVLDQRQPYVSQQLMKLREAGLVTDRRDGLMVYYSLAEERLVAVLSITRDILRATGVDIEVEDVPELPVQGCSCPKCTEMASCAA